MDILTREDEPTKPEFQLGDIIQTVSGDYYFLMKHRGNEGIVYMFTDTEGVGATGKYTSIEELVDASQSNIIRHFPRDLWALKLVRK